MIGLTLRNESDIVVVDLDGVFDIDSEDGVHSVVIGGSEGKFDNIVWNFQNVASITSGGIGVILDAVKDLTRHGRFTKFVNVSPRVLDALGVFKVLPALNIHPDEASAIKQIHIDLKAKKDAYVRLFERAIVTNAVKYRPFKDGAVDSSFIDAESNCVSMCGLYIRSEKTFEEDTLLEVRLSLPGGFFGTQIRSIAKVVWEADEQKQPALYPGMALSTLCMEKKERCKLSDYLEKLGIK